MIKRTNTNLAMSSNRATKKGIDTMRQLLLCITLLTATHITFADTLLPEATGSSATSNSAPLNYDNFLQGLKNIFVTPKNPVTRPATSVPGSTPPPASDTLRETKIKINLSQFLGTSSNAPSTLNAKVNCAYQALLSPVNQKDFRLDDKIAALTACGIEPSSIDESITNAIEKARKAYRYKLIIEKCSRDVQALDACKSDKSASSNSVPSMGDSSTAGYGQCHATVTKKQSDIDALLTQCSPRSFYKKWEEIRDFTQTSYTCLAKSTHAKSCSEDGICTECRITYPDGTLVTAKERKGHKGGCSPLADDFQPLLNGVNDIIKETRDYVGALLAKKIGQSVSVTTLPGLLEYDNLTTNESTCMTDSRSTDQQQLVEKILTVSANIVNHASGSAMKPVLPLPDNIVLSGQDGMSFVSLDNSRDVDSSFKKNSGEAIRNIQKTRLEKKRNLDEAQRKAEQTVAGSSMMLSSALSNLNWLLNQRLTKVSDSSDKSCTPQELQRVAMTERLKPAWNKRISTAGPNVLLKEITFLLADIQKQLFQNHQLQERMLVAQSMTQLYNASQMATSFSSNSSEDDITVYTKGSTCSEASKPGAPSK